MNKEQFIIELSKLNVKITEQQLEQLNEYYNILVTENKLYNLTAITKEEDVYLKHFLDSISIVRIIILDNQSLCDIGTGAGFPGIVLKIMFSNLKVTLVEANKKKCKFLEKVINILNLKDITVINERAEIYAINNREKYDIVTARAVAPLKHLLEYSIPLVKVNGLYIAMKGNCEEEILEIKNYYNILNIELVKLINFKLPIENSERTLISFIKQAKTDIKYPRKYSEIKKQKLDVKK